MDIQPVVSTEELSSVLRLLQDNSTPLRSLSSTIRSQFRGNDLFRIGCACCILLHDDLLTRVQRTVAVHFLGSLTCEAATSLRKVGKIDTRNSRPFVHFLLNHCGDSPSVPADALAMERLLLGKVLVGGEPRKALEELNSSEVIVKLSGPQQSEEAERRALEGAASTHHPLLKGVPGLEVRPVVLAPQNSFHEDTAAATPGTEEEAKANEQSKIQQAAEGASRAVATKAYTAERRVPFAMEQLESQRLIRIEGSTPKQEDARAETKQAEKRGGRSSADKETKEMQKSSGFATRPVFSPFDIKGFRPALARPTPPLLDMSSDEVAWWQPMGAMELLWDPEVGGGNANVATARRLMLKGFAGPLNSEDTEKFLELLDKEPSLVQDCGLTPAKLPQLVENNPMIAVECLLRLINRGAVAHADYLMALVKMRMSLHSMEVVNRLTTSLSKKDIPADFLHLYISNCISSCENTSDRYMQTRLVRLVCVFLQSLIRNNIIKVQDLFIEVQAFCIEFSRVREAAALFRLLKQWDSQSPSGDGSSG